MSQSARGKGRGISSPGTPPDWGSARRDLGPDMLAAANDEIVDHLTTMLKDLPDRHRRRVSEACGFSPNSDHKTVEYSASSVRKIRIFSGKKPVPNGEVDYETWRLLATTIVEDDHMSESDKRRHVVQSLLRPALELVQGQDEIPVHDMITFLDTVFGPVLDGGDLFVKFLTTNQESKEGTGEYLIRLYTMGLKVVQHNKLTLQDLSKYVLEQFARGSHDEQLLDKLKVEERVHEGRIPEYSSFLLEVRTAEAKRTEKRLRLKANGTSKSEVAVAKACSSSDPVTEELRSLRQELAKLKAQTKSHDQAKQQKSNGNAKPSSTAKPWRFCYNCGDPGHFKDKCQNQANPLLVQQKLIARADDRKKSLN